MSNNEMNCSNELAAKINEKYTEINALYTIDVENYQRFIKVYDLLKKLALLCEGSVSDVIMDHESEYAQISAEVPNIEVYPDSKGIFCGLLDLADNISFSNTGNDSVLIKVDVKGIWKAVTPAE